MQLPTFLKLFIGANMRAEFEKLRIKVALAVATIVRQNVMLNEKEAMIEAAKAMVEAKDSMIAELTAKLADAHTVAPVAPVDTSDIDFSSLTSSLDEVLASIPVEPTILPHADVAHPGIFDR